LPGRGLRRVAVAISATRCRLWLAADHLLAVDSSMAAESYRRFYFRDIEAFVVRRTSARQNWNVFFLIMGLLTAGPFFLLWLNGGDGGFLFAAICIAVFWGVLALLNTLRGPTCQTHIRTAVQLEQLPSLGRLRVAEKVIARLQPLIVAAQGVSTPEEVTAASWALEEPIKPRPMEPGRTASTGGTDKGTLHGALFCLLIVEAILAGIFFIIYQEPLSTLGMIAMFAGFVLCIFALVRQAGSDLPAGMRTAAKWALGSYILKCVVGFIYTVVYTVRHQGKPVITGLEIIGEPGFDMAALACIAIGAVIGVGGLIQTLAHARSRALLPAA
jgi:hypothetical protein